MTIILAAKTCEGIVFAYDLCTVKKEPFSNSNRTYMQHKVKPWRKDTKGKEKALLGVAGTTPYSMDELVDQLRKQENEPLESANAWLHKLSRPPKTLSIGFFKRHNFELEPQKLLEKAKAQLAIAYISETAHLAVSENYGDVVFREVDRWGAGFGFDCYPTVQQKFTTREFEQMPLSQIVEELTSIVQISMIKHNEQPHKACKTYELKGLGIRIITHTGYAVTEDKEFCYHTLNHPVNATKK